MASLQSSKNGGVTKVQDEEKDMPEVSESKCSEKEREHIAQERGGKIEDVENVEVHDRGFLDAPMKGSNGIVGDEEDKFRNQIECEGEEKEEKKEKDEEGGGKDKDLKEGAHEQEEKRKEKDKEVEEVEDEGKELKEKKEKKKGKKAKEKEEEEEKESKEPKEKKKKKDDDKDEKEKEKKDGEKGGDEKEEEKKTDKEKKKDKKKDKKEPKTKVEKLMQKIEKIEAKMQKLVLKKEECLKMLSAPQEAQPGTPPHEGVVETENAKEKGPCERAAETVEERELKISDVSSITTSNTKLEVPTVEGCDAAIPTGTVSTAVDETVTILATNK